MTDHGRKYSKGKNGESYVLPIWNGILDHRQQIGSAIWEFIWCVDKVTAEDSGVGMVLNGAPVKLQAILKDIPGSDPETVRLHMRKLEKGGYIKRRRTPYGYVIQVLNSKKRDIWKPEKPQNTVSLPEEKPQNTGTETAFHGERNRKIGVNKEDSAVTQQEDAASKPSAPDSLNPWKVLGSDLPMGSPRFQKLFEHYASTRHGNRLSEAMERTIQMANKQAVKVPPPFFDAKREVERREKEELAAPSDDIPVLEAEPWAK